MSNHTTLNSITTSTTIYTPSSSNSSNAISTSPTSTATPTTTELTLPALYTVVTDFMSAHDLELGDSYQLAYQLELFADVMVDKVLDWTRRVLKGERMVLQELRWVRGERNGTSGEENLANGKNCVGTKSGDLLEMAVEPVEGGGDARAQLLEICMQVREVVAEVDVLMEHDSVGNAESECLDECHVGAQNEVY